MPTSNTTSHNHRFKNLIGQRFGRLTVEGEAGRDKFKRMKWACVCDCGTKCVVHGNNLRRGHTTSCGCEFRAKLRARSTRHGHATKGKVTRTFRAWAEMFRRCHNPACKSYPDYGGRGITVAAGWRESFEAFLADVGECPGPEYTLDRVDVNGHYEPGNVRWATRTEQARNKRATRYVEYRGERRSVPEWCEQLGLKLKSVSCRLNRGWDVVRAFETPLRDW